MKLRRLPGQGFKDSTRPCPRSQPLTKEGSVGFAFLHLERVDGTREKCSKAIRLAAGERKSSQRLLRL